MEDNTMQQDERITTGNNEATGGIFDIIRLKIIIKNQSGHSFNVDKFLKSGEEVDGIAPLNNTESDSHENVRIGICEKDKETIYLFEQYHLKGPQGALYFTAVDHGQWKFKLYFDLSILEENPRCAYIFPYGDYSFVSPICCFPTLGDCDTYTYTVEFTISDPELCKCNSFYHVTDTHFNPEFDEGDQAERFKIAHEILFDRINNDNTSLGLIHTGDITHEGQNFSQYEKYYLKAPNVQKYNEESNPKYLKNLYEGYGNHDRSNVIERIKERHEHWLENDSQDQCAFEDCASNGLHYYWRWRGVYFIHLNLAPIDGKDGNDALAYLNMILNRLYIEWGKLVPVILCFHYLISLSIPEEHRHKVDFLTDQQKKDIWDVVKDYNVCAILCGHVHTMFNRYMFSFTYNGEEYRTSIPCFCAGALKPVLYKSERIIKSTYYRFEFDEENNKIVPYRNYIEFPENAPKKIREDKMKCSIDISSGKKPACDIYHITSGQDCYFE